MPTPLKYLRQLNRGGTSDYPIEAIERALDRSGVPSVLNDGALSRLIGKAVARTPLARHISPVTTTTFLVPIMGPCFYRFFPQVLGAQTIPVAHDCWEPDFDRWVSFLRRANISRAFFTCRAAAHAMMERVPGLYAEWLPEAIELGFFNPVFPLSARGIDVLELGRRWDRFHTIARQHCVERSFRHLYQRSPTELIFPTRDEFRMGLADTKILVCFPCSLTNPERSGAVETMTLRYLEAIACRSVILGRAPMEMIDLFGYNPIVEFDERDPRGQLDRLIADIDSFLPMVNQNWSRLREIGTWDIRIATLLTNLAREGIVPQATDEA